MAEGKKRLATGVRHGLEIELIAWVNRAIDL